jgi:hypothetical protein
LDPDHRADCGRYAAESFHLSAQQRETRDRSFGGNWVRLGGKYDRAEKYPQEEEAERKREAAIEEYQAQQALSEGEPVEDHSVLSKVLRGISLAALVITLALAARVMFWSPDASVYEANRDFFYRYGFVCTIVYFVFAYWALRRRLALNK